MLTCWSIAKRQWIATAAAYALALGVKMNALLYLPGIVISIILAAGLEQTIGFVGTVAQIQVSLFCEVVEKQALLAFQFTQHAKNYVLKAFDFGRAFLWKWTVNWRFVDEKIFLSREFAWCLLLGHALTLSLFIVTRWIK
jgi:alpha-1,3-mannosyltransferase